MNELGKKWAWVQIFENRGAIMGCSNAHPHCQIWSSSFLPFEAKKKDDHLRDYYNRNKAPLLIDYVNKELVKMVDRDKAEEYWLRNSVDVITAYLSLTGTHRDREL